MAFVPTTSDEELLALLRNETTREQGFRLLLRSYQERLYAHIRSMVGNHADTDDVLQNALVKVFRNIDKFAGNAALYTWLYRIATNEALTFLQRRKRQNTVSTQDETLNLGQRLVAQVAFDAERAEVKLARAIAALPEKQQQVFLLRYYEEKTYREMSKTLGVSEGALKANYHHAVKKIEQSLREE